MTLRKASARGGGKVSKEAQRLNETAAATSAATVAGAADAETIPSRGQRAVVARGIVANAGGGGGVGRGGGVAGRTVPQGPLSLSASAYVPAVPPLTTEGPHSAQGLCVMDAVPLEFLKQSPFSQLERVHAGIRTPWTATVGLTLAWANGKHGDDQESIDRGLKFFLVAPAVMLRNPTRGGKRSSNVVQQRFDSVKRDGYSVAVTVWMADFAKVTARQTSEDGVAMDGVAAMPRAQNAASETTDTTAEAELALKLARKGQLGKAVRVLTGHGVADARDPRVVAQLQAKTPRRTRAMPDGIVGPPGDTRLDLGDLLLALRPHVAQGQDAWRNEYLKPIGEHHFDPDAKAAKRELE